MIESRYADGRVLDRPVLVLNRLWQAVNVCSARRAIALLYAGHAQVVHEDGDGFQIFRFEAWCEVAHAADPSDMVHGVSLAMRCPRVVVLGRFDRLPDKEVRFSRSNLFARDHHVCQYCRVRHERKDLNIDHVVPRHRGGKTVWTNVVCCCIACNRRKGNRTPEEARMPLLRQPKKPRWQPFLEIQFARNYDESWSRFLDMSSWKVELGDS